MRDLMMTIRRSAVDPAQTCSGQAIVLFAIAITVIIGMVGLAVDVGHAYERRQFLQGAAHNAAIAGAFELNNGSASLSNRDAAVVQRMVDTLRQSGLTVANFNSSSSTLTTPSSWTACQASSPLSPTQVYLQANYTSSSGATSIPVGTGSPPSGYDGIQVLRLAMCVPRFFTGVIGHGNYDVSVGAAAGQTDTGLPSSASIAPFYIYGDIIKKSSTSYMPSLYGVDANDLAAPKTKGNGGNGPPWEVACSSTALSVCHTTPGDLVTVHDQAPAGGSGSESWEAVQFFDSPPSGGLFSTGYKADGLNYKPHGFTLPDQSDRGCLDTTVQDLNSIVLGNWYYNHGGQGHCASPPIKGNYILVPIVDEVCKNNTCQDGTSIPVSTSAPCQGRTGGYCVQIAGEALVYISTVTGSATRNSGKLVQGYIVGVYKDPFCIVQIGSSAHPAYHPACTYSFTS